MKCLSEEFSSLEENSKEIKKKLLHLSMLGVLEVFSGDILPNSIGGLRDLRFCVPH